MKPSSQASSPSTISGSKPLSSKKQIPQSTRQSLMSMMRQIMEKSCLYSDELHNIPQQSVEQSVIDKDDTHYQPQANYYHNKPTKHLFSANQNNSQKIITPISPSFASNPPQPTQQLSHHIPTQFSKLISITQRCISYYNTFSQQKCSQFQIIQKTFSDINSNLNLAFEQMIGELVQKQKELKLFLLKKYQEIIDFRERQDNCLKYSLSQINEIPLTQQKSPQQFSSQLHNYTSKLNEFYTTMQQIQKSNFKQMVEQSVNFINNLVTEQIRVTLYQKIPSRLTEKRMMRQNSKDFLLESRDNSIEGRSDTFGILDVQSFTKLFFDTDYQKGENATNNNNKDDRVQLQKNNACFNIESKDQFQQNKKIIKGLKNIQPLSQTKDQNKLLQNLNDFAKKQSSQVPLSPVQKSTINQDNQNDHQLELIKKISSQQSNRSAKIRGYLVSFQDTKLQSQEVPSSKKPETSRQLNHSKSSLQVSKTPTKFNKSVQKKLLTCSVQVNHNSNEQKLKNSSLKTQRNSTAIVSEFKINSSRRQSVAVNK